LLARGAGSGTGLIHTSARSIGLGVENGVWRSPVAHLLWEQGVGGSNPSTPTSILGAIHVREPLTVAECCSIIPFRLPAVAEAWKDAPVAQLDRASDF
jgi:hypothetical protein